MIIEAVPLSEFYYCLSRVLIGVRSIFGLLEFSVRLKW